jgi:hypothetical protein
MAACHIMVIPITAIICGEKGEDRSYLTQDCREGGGRVKKEGQSEDGVIREVGGGSGGDAAG